MRDQRIECPNCRGEEVNVAEHPEDQRKRYSVDLYMSTYSTYHVEAKTEEEAYALAKAERQHDLERFGQGSSTVEYWLNRWQAWPDCDTVEEEGLEGCWRPSPTQKVATPSPSEHQG